MSIINTGSINRKKPDHLLFIVILTAAVFLRLGTFYVTHGTGDQVLYHAMAMKLDREGFKGYNLQNVGLMTQNASTSIVIEKDPQKTFLAEQKRTGFYYYDEPLFYSPPLFSYLIYYSHKIFAPYAGYQFSENNHLVFHGSDFYLDIVPLVFSVLMILPVYLFCLFFIDQETGLLASILLTVSPTAILSADRIWSDSILSFFMFGSAFLFLLSNKKSNIYLSVGSGILSGLAVLTKDSGLFVVLILGFYSLVVMSWNSTRNKELALQPEIKNYIILCIITALLTLPWFTKMYMTFGDPLHFPSQPNVEQINSWFAFVRHRPWFTYPLDILFQNPIWIFAVIGCFVRPHDRIRFFLLAWIAVLAMYLTLAMQGKENRYMLPAYPAIAILSAQGINYTLEILRRKSLKWPGILLKLAVIASLLFSTLVAISWVDLFQRPEITKPF